LPAWVAPVGIEPTS